MAICLACEKTFRLAKVEITKSAARGQHQIIIGCPSCYELIGNVYLDITDKGQIITKISQYEILKD
jgi:Fe-S oxidoreductase